MLNFRNDGTQPGPAAASSMQYRGNQQVEKHGAQPQVDDDEKIEQLALFGITASTERQVDEKRQRSEQDNDQVH